MLGITTSAQVKIQEAPGCWCAALSFDLSMKSRMIFIGTPMLFQLGCLMPPAQQDDVF